MGRSRARRWAVLALVSAVAVLSLSVAATGLLVVAFARRTRRRPQVSDPRRDAVIDTLSSHSETGSGGVCILFAVDPTLLRADTIVRLLRGVARSDDLIVALNETCVAIVARGVPREVDLAALVCRCQAAIEDRTDAPTLSAGLATAQRGTPAEAVFRSAEKALAIAMSRGAGEIEMADAALVLARPIQAPDTSPLLETWIEPRLHVASRKVSAIAPVPRWRHPALGLLDAEDVLDRELTPATSANLLLRLLEDGLTALDRLDGGGPLVPLISVALPDGVAGVSGLAARIAFALDRADIAPERLELRLGGPVDHEELTCLGRIGCRVAAEPDVILPDSVGPARPAMIVCARSDAEKSSAFDPAPPRLEREIIAISVDCPEQAARLATLGATHLQGPVVSEPLPLHEIVNWVATHRPCSDTSGISGLSPQVWRDDGESRRAAGS